MDIGHNYWQASATSCKILGTRTHTHTHHKSLTHVFHSIIHHPLMTSFHSSPTYTHTHTHTHPPHICTPTPHTTPTPYSPIHIHTLLSTPSLSYFLLQRCWQFVATERPTFAVIANELKDLAKKPTRHITLKSSRDEFTPGYVSENGQVFIHAVPLQGQNVRLSRRSGTQHSLISSIDDTIYSRETAETMIYVQSEMETEDHSGEEFDEEATAEWVNTRGRDGRRARLPNGVLRNKRVRISDESEENGNNHGISSNGALSTSEDSDRQASNQSESEDESHDGSQDRLVRF